MHDAAVGTDRNINARLLEIFIARIANVDHRRRLPATDALLLARNADRAAADADLNEIGARLRQKSETVSVDHIACANLDVVAEVLMNVFESDLLPLAEALGRIDAENVGARLEQCGNSLGVIASVDARAHYVTFLLVDELERIGLVVGVILSKNHVTEPLFLIDEREHIELVLPNKIVRHGERSGIGVGVDQFVERRHEILSLLVAGHSRDAIVAAGDDAEEFTRRLAVVGDRHGRMPRLFEERKNFFERGSRLDV